MKPHIIDEYSPLPPYNYPSTWNEAWFYTPTLRDATTPSNSPVTIVTPSFQRTAMTSKEQSMPAIVVLPPSGCCDCSVVYCLSKWTVAMLPSSDY